MDAELVERVLECLRGLEIGESISADGIADEIGAKLSDVYDALEDLENAKLVEMHPACRKGSDPTYTLTPKGKRHMQPEVQERLEPEPVKEDHDAPELRPSADRTCRFCGKNMEPNKLGRHEHMCGKNPGRPRTPLNLLKKTKPREESIEVPAPAEYAEAESNATAVLEHEVEAEPEILEQLNAEDPDVPDEVPDYSPANNADAPKETMEMFLERVQASDALVLEGSPGMDAALRLIEFCHRALASGADIHLSASVHVAAGLDISVYLDHPEGAK